MIEPEGRRLSGTVRLNLKFQIKQLVLKDPRTLAVRTLAIKGLSGFDLLRLTHSFLPRDIA